MSRAPRKPTPKQKTSAKPPAVAAKTSKPNPQGTPARPKRGSRKRVPAIHKVIVAWLRHVVRRESPLPTPKRASNGARRIREPRYASFQFSKQLKSIRPKVPSAFRLMKMALRTLWRNWFVFSGILLVYLVLAVVLVKGLGNAVDVTSVRDGIQGIFSGFWGQALSGVAVFGSLISNTSSPTSQAAGAYQLVLLVVFSLAVVWALRQIMAGEQIGIRDAFYKGMYPLVPVMLVVLVAMIELLPSVLASYLYNLAYVQGIAATILEKVLWALLIALLVIWTIYMLMSTVIALYIATLPDMKPLQALRSARELVRFRRWSVLRKLFFLPLALLVLGLLIMMPLIFLLPWLAEWIFFVLSLFALIIAHAYMYTFYRELLK